MQIKVCGLTRKKDVDYCCKLGVNALGFILAESPRQIKLKRVERLVEGIPPFISRVAVVVNPSQAEINRIIASAFFDYVQFHGEEEPEVIAKVPTKTIKAINIGSDLNQAQKKINNYQTADYYLFDTRSGSKKGGTGRTFDWDLLDRLEFKKQFILAGGLGFDNIESALSKVEMSGVDLNSRVESLPGIKSHDLINKTINKIRHFFK